MYVYMNINVYIYTYISIYREEKRKKYASEYSFLINS